MYFFYFFTLKASEEELSLVPKYQASDLVPNRSQ